MNVAQGGALIDLEAFYDSIEYPILADTALRLNVPPVVLGLEMQTCVMPICCRSSILSYCRFRVLEGLPKTLCTAHPRMSERIWIDDLAQRTAGSRVQVRRDLIDAIADA
eukprot:8670201-Pyramimonas_sp.AAC.1